MTILIMACIVFIGSFIQGMLGFGFGLVAIPALSFLLGPKVAIATCMLIGFLNNVGLSIGLRKHITIKRFLPLIITGVATVPLGSYLLYMLNANYIKLVLGAVILVTSLGYLFGMNFNIKNEQRGLAWVGLMSGTLAGCVGIGGPPIIFFLTNQKEEKMSFKANLVFYFFLLGLAIVPSYMVAGLLTLDIFKLSMMLFVPMVVGMFAGGYATKYVSQRVFTKLVLACLCTSGLMLVVNVIIS